MLLILKRKIVFFVHFPDLTSVLLNSLFFVNNFRKFPWVYFKLHFKINRIFGSYYELSFKNQALYFGRLPELYDFFTLHFLFSVNFVSKVTGTQLLNLATIEHAQLVGSREWSTVL